jgi:DNA-binding response OmpR family regulator
LPSGNKIKNVKILIIEDEVQFEEYYKKYSEENDTYQVEEAEDGVAGLEK